MSFPIAVIAKVHSHEEYAMYPLCLIFLQQGCLCDPCHIAINHVGTGYFLTASANTAAPSIQLAWACLGGASLPTVGFDSNCNARGEMDGHGK